MCDILYNGNDGFFFAFNCALNIFTPAVVNKDSNKGDERSFLFTLHFAHFYFQRMGDFNTIIVC